MKLAFYLEENPVLLLLILKTKIIFLTKYLIEVFVIGKKVEM